MRDSVSVLELPEAERTPLRERPYIDLVGEAEGSVCFCVSSLLTGGSIPASSPPHRWGCSHQPRSPGPQSNLNSLSKVGIQQGWPTIHSQAPRLGLEKISPGQELWPILVLLLGLSLSSHWNQQGAESPTLRSSFIEVNLVPAPGVTVHGNIMNMAQGRAHKA